MKNLFQKYNHLRFVETGTGDGLGIQDAIYAGFQEIYSIELDHRLWGLARYRFKTVTCINGDSRDHLEKLLNVPCFIWLDAHYSGPGTAEDYPILNELQIISESKLKHVLAIDDVRYFGKDGKFNIDLALWLDDYDWIKVDGRKIKNDVLITEMK